MPWQAVRARSLAQEREVAQRRIAIGLLAVRDVSDVSNDAQRPAVDILRVELDVPIAGARDALRPVQVEEVRTGDPMGDFRRRGRCYRAAELWE